LSDKGGTPRKNEFAVFAKRLLAVPKQEVKDLERKAKEPKPRRKPKF